jgi:hypothetical protein
VFSSLLGCEKLINTINNISKNTRYLAWGKRYDAAYSTCKTCLFLLPKIIASKEGCQCFVKSFITTKACKSYEFMLNQTLIVVEIPKQLQLSYTVLTPEINQSEIVLPVTWIEDRLDWIRPVFRSSYKPEELEKVKETDLNNNEENPYRNQFLT